MEIFIDANIFIRFFLGKMRLDLFEDMVEGKIQAHTSILVLEETNFKLLYLKTYEELGKVNQGMIKKNLRDNPKTYTDIFEYLNFLLELAEGGVLRIISPNNNIMKHALELQKKYSLLPNDALISATCKFYGIKKIATFDKDFSKVDFLEVFRP